MRAPPGLRCAAAARWRPLEFPVVLGLRGVLPRGGALTAVSGGAGAVGCAPRPHGGDALTGGWSVGAGAARAAARGRPWIPPPPSVRGLAAGQWAEASWGSAVSGWGRRRRQSWGAAATAKVRATATTTPCQG